MKRAIPYPARLGLIYLIFSILWVLLTDRLVFWLVPDPSQATTISTYKGWFFVLASTALIYFSLVREMARREQAEGNLRKSEMRAHTLANVIEKSFQPFGIGYPDGRLGAVNAAFCDLVGYGSEELNTMDWIVGLTPPEWREHEAQYLAELRRTGKPVRFEKEFFRKDGSRVPIELFVHQENDEGGNPLYYYSFITDLTERKQSENFKKENEERYRSLAAELENFFQVNLDLLCIADMDGYFRKLNPQWERTLGFTLDELEGHRFLDLVHPDDLEATLAAISRLSAQQEVLDFTNRYRCKDGDYRWIEWRSVPRGNQVYAAARDITEHRRAEQALRESEKRFEDAFEYAPIGMALVGLDQRLVHVNRALCNILGYDKATLMTLTVPVITHPDDVGKEMVLKRDMLGGNREYYQIEKRYLHADGRIVWGLLSVSLMTDPQGQPLYFIAQLEDITERKQAEEGLRQAEAALLESEYWLKESQRIAGIGSYVMDIAAGQWLSSPVLNEIFGIGAKFDRSVDGWASVIHPDHRPMMVEYFTNLLTMHQNFDKEYRITRQNDGQERWVHGLGNFDYDDSGRPLWMYGTIQDITDRKRAELALHELNNALEERVRQRTAQLEASNRELETFSYTVSHDLRAPLRHLDGYSRILVEECGEQLDTQARSYLEHIRESSAHMGQLIDALLNLSRLARNELHRKLVAISALAHSVVDGLRQHDSQRVVEFTIQEDLIAYADETLLCVVLENLLGNAWKFTSEREKAQIEFGADLLLSQNTNEPVFFVRDNGAGFDMAYVDKLFGAFQRLHRADEFPGTGVGLATVQRIIHRHGGRVWAESVSDQGATFYFTLPVAQDE
jgi:PAS domain S-box-containing protein